MSETPVGKAPTNDEGSPEYMKASTFPEHYVDAAAAYPIVAHRAGDNWAAFAPDLPGCVAAADTREATEQLMREAIAFHLEGMDEDGETWPVPGKRTATEYA
jgi:predicted RNase H-like HicB family nuclease